MTFSPVGSLIQTSGTGLSSFSLTPANVNDLIMVAVYNAVSSAVYATSLSSSNVTWVPYDHFTGTNNASTMSIFAGQVNAASAATVTVTWSGTTPTTMVQVDGQEFSSSVGAWMLDTAGHIDVVSPGTNTWASLTPAGSGELYFGYAGASATATVGSTSGYTYTIDLKGDCVAYDAACTSSAQAPVWGNSVQIFGSMVLVKETKAPMFIASYSPASDWTSATTPKTDSVTAISNDLLVVFGGTENGGSIKLGVPSDGSNAYTLRQSFETTNLCGSYAWTTIVGGAVPLTITTTSLPGATNGVSYSATVLATGGTSTGYTWSVSAGALPAWATLNNSTGIISGTPTGAGTVIFTVQVVDSAGNSDTQPLTLVTSNSVSPVGPGGAWNLIFADDFSGSSLDTTNWTALTMNNFSGGVPVDASNVSVSGGNCILQMSGSTGAVINTNPSYQGWGPGSSGPVVAVGDCVEARINFPGPSGDAAYNWPAFWISGANWPANGEEDIFESYNGTPSALNYHTNSGANNGPFPAGTWCNGFHTYTLVRGSSTYDCYWDGTLVRSVAMNDNGGAQSIMVDVVNGGGQAATGVTSQVLVDYVRLWSPA